MSERARHLEAVSNPPVPARYTFACHRAETEGLSGAESAEVFDRLPPAMQAEAWEHLAEETERQREAVDG